MISEAEFYGGSRSEAPSADTSIGEDDVRLIVYRPTVGVDTLLPPHSTQPKGGPRFYILNDSLFALAIKRSNGSILQVIGSKGAGDPQGVILVVGATDWIRELLSSGAGVTS